MDKELSCKQIKYIDKSSDLKGFIPHCTVVAHKKNGHPILRLCQDIVYTSLLDNGRSYPIHIPAGFIFDGASLPKPVWSIVGSPVGIYLFAALVHDMLYCSRALNRHEADHIFYDLLLRLGVPKIKASIFFNSVRLFGGNAFNNTDERPIISVLLRDSKYNPYLPSMMRLSGVICNDFSDYTWRRFSNSEFEKKFLGYIKDN